MEVRALHGEEDYDWALAQIGLYFENPPKPGTPEADRFDVLADLIEAYERRVWPIEPAGALDAIRFVMELKGLKQADLAKLIGSRSRASEILSGRRTRTPRMMAKLHARWGVPAESLLKNFEDAA